MYSPYCKKIRLCIYKEFIVFYLVSQGTLDFFHNNFGIVYKPFNAAFEEERIYVLLRHDFFTDIRPLCVLEVYNSISQK